MLCAAMQRVPATGPASSMGIMLWLVSMAFACQGARGMQAGAGMQAIVRSHHQVPRAIRRQMLQSNGLDCDFTSYQAFQASRSTQTWSVAGADGGLVFKACIGVNVDGLQLTDVYTNIATKEEQRVTYTYTGNLTFGSDSQQCPSQFTTGQDAVISWAAYLQNGNLTQVMAAGLPQRPYLPFALDSICYDSSTDCSVQGAAVCSSGNSSACPVTCNSCPAAATWQLTRTELSISGAATITSCCDQSTACTAHTSEVQFVPDANAPVAAPEPSPPSVSSTGAPLDCQVTSYDAFLQPSSTQTTTVQFSDNSTRFQSCLGMQVAFQRVDVYINQNTSEVVQVPYSYTGFVTTGSISDTCANQSAGSDLLQAYSQLLTQEGGLDTFLATQLVNSRPTLPFPVDSICADTQPACRTQAIDQVCAAGSSLTTSCPVTCNSCGPQQVWQLTNNLLGNVTTADITTCCDTNTACTEFTSGMQWMAGNISTSPAPPEDPPPPVPSPLPLTPSPSTGGGATPDDLELEPSTPAVSENSTNLTAEASTVQEESSAGTKQTNQTSPSFNGSTVITSPGLMSPSLSTNNSSPRNVTMPYNSSIPSANATSPSSPNVTVSLPPPQSPSPPTSPSPSQQSPVPANIIGTEQSPPASNSSPNSPVPSPTSNATTSLPPPAPGTPSSRNTSTTAAAHAHGVNMFYCLVPSVIISLLSAFLHFLL